MNGAASPPPVLSAVTDKGFPGEEDGGQTAGEAEDMVEVEEDDNDDDDDDDDDGSKSFAASVSIAA